MSRPVKLLMDWNIKAGQEEAYFDFVMQELLTIFLQAGFRLTDAWYTVYGDWPQVRIGFLAEDLEAVEDFLASEAWLDLKQELFTYILDYHQKVVWASGGFQL